MRRVGVARRAAFGYTPASEDERPMFLKLASTYLPMTSDRQPVEGDGARVEAM